MNLYIASKLSGFDKKLLASIKSKINKNYFRNYGWPT